MIKIRKILVVCGVLLSLIVFAPVVAAALIGTADVSGNPSAFLELTVNGSQSFGAMTVGTHVNSTANNVTATVVSNAPWSVSVSDALTTSKPVASLGSMAEWDGAAYPDPGKYLINALQISEGGNPWVTTPSPLFSDTIAGTSVWYPSFQQVVVNEDQSLPTHMYRMVITFTATAV